MFKCRKKLGAEEITDVNLQAVADLFDGGNGGAVVSSADDIIKGGLRNAGECCHTVDGYVVLGAQFQYALARCLADIQCSTSLAFDRYDTIIVPFFYRKT